MFEATGPVRETKLFYIDGHWIDVQEVEDIEEFLTGGTKEAINHLVRMAYLEAEEDDDHMYEELAIGMRLMDKEVQKIRKEVKGLKKPTKASFLSRLERLEDIIEMNLEEERN